MPPAVPTTAIVPHPDDEVLLFGGLLHLQAQRGVPVRVVAVTDGDAGVRGASAALAASVRSREQRRALRCLHPAIEVERLHLPDGAVVDHEPRVIAGAVERGAGLIVAPWIHDHHADHEACGRAGVAAAQRTGAVLMFGLFWAWTRSDPRQVTTRMVALALDDGARRRRRAAIEQHRSQLARRVEGGLLDDDLLTPLEWAREHYLESFTTSRGTMVRRWPPLAGPPAGDSVSR